MFRGTVSINDYVNRDALEIIFSFLPIVDKFRLQRVCRYWKTLLKRLLDGQKAILIKGNLWSSECRYDSEIHYDRDNLGPTFQRNTTSKVEVKKDDLALILSKCPNVRVIQMVDVTIDGSGTLITIANLCRRLECLNLFVVETSDKRETLDLGLKQIACASGEKLKHLYLRAMSRKFTEETLRDIFKTCPNLEVVDVENSIVTISDVSLPHLTKNMMRFSGAFCGVRLRDNSVEAGLRDSGVTVLCRDFGLYLKELRLSGINDLMLAAICRNLTNLQSLELFWDERDTTPRNCHMIGFLNNLTRLALRVKDEYADFFDKDVLKILQGCPKLKTLILGLPVGDGCLTKIPKYCPDVDSLGLIFAKNPKVISDDSILAFAKLRNLKILDVWDSPCSNEACIALIKSCPKLHYLAFRACRHVSNPTLYTFIKRAHKQREMKFKFCHVGTRIVLSSHDFHIIPDNLKVKQIYRLPFW